MLVKLTLGKFRESYREQMHLYCNYAREHWTLPDENPPVGLILCSGKGEALARYALEGLPNVARWGDEMGARPAIQRAFKF